MSFLPSQPESHSAQAVADLLNKEGIKTGRGLTWTIGAVRRPLKAARRLLEDSAANGFADHPLFGDFEPVFAFCAASDHLTSGAALAAPVLALHRSWPSVSNMAPE